MALIDRKIKDNIAYWSIHSPETRNAISRKILQELFAFLEEWSRLPIADLPRVLVLEGVPGVAFSAGADLKERKTMSLTEVEDFLSRFRAMLQLLENLPIPTIAALSGTALGGGLEIALACDFRIIREDAKIGLPEAKLGIIPGAGGTQRLSRLIGVSSAKEWIYSGKIYTGQEALSQGVANYCYTDDEFSNKLHEFSLGFLDTAPISIQAAKYAIQEGIDCDLEKGLDIEMKYYKTTLETKDRLEALQAFQEKRKPIFRGE